MFLSDVQFAVARHINDQPWFRDQSPPIEAVPANDAVLVQKQAATLQRLGIGVLVYALGGDFEHHSSAILRYKGAQFGARVRENVGRNRSVTGSRQPAEEVAEQVAAALHLFTPMAPDGRVLTGAGVIVKGIAPGEDEPGINAWDVLFEIAGDLRVSATRRAFSSVGEPLPEV